MRDVLGGSWTEDFLFSRAAVGATLAEADWAVALAVVLAVLVALMTVRATEEADEDMTDTDDDAADEEEVAALSMVPCALRER